MIQVTSPRLGATRYHSDAQDTRMLKDIIIDVALVALSAVSIVCFVIDYRRRKRPRRRPDAPRRPEDDFTIKPFDSYGILYSFAEFQDLLKFYSCSSDNGTGRWASADGVWINKWTGELFTVEPNDVRLGKRPETFFTHIVYYGK
jgi:hypothetical protein